MAQKKNTPKETPAFVSEDDGSRHRLDGVPTLTSRLKAGFRRALSGAQTAARPVTDRLAALNELDGAAVAQKAYAGTERVVGETMGALSGSIRGLLGFTVGAAAGLIPGVFTVTPGQVAQLRLRAGEMEPIGHSEGTLTRNGKSYVKVRTARKGLLDALVPESARGTNLYALPLSNSTRERLNPTGEAPTEGVVIALSNAKTHRIEAFLFVEETEAGTVWAWDNG